MCDVCAVCVGLWAYKGTITIAEAITILRLKTNCINQYELFMRACACVCSYVCWTIARTQFESIENPRINKLIPAIFSSLRTNMEFNIENNHNKWVSNECEWIESKVIWRLFIKWIWKEKRLHYRWTCVCTKRKQQQQNNPKLLGDCLDMVTVVILYDKHISSFFS